MTNIEDVVEELEEQELVNAEKEIASDQSGQVFVVSADYVPPPKPEAGNW